MNVLTAYEAQNLLEKYTEVSKSVLTKNIDEALGFGIYPSVLKIISKEALHKTEIKGVRIVNNKQDLMQQYSELLQIAIDKKLKIEGIMVQKFEEGTEVFVGIKKDATFGHVIGLGIGGIFVEELNDVQWRKCPITTKDAESMIEHLKFKKIIKGARGTQNNIAALKKTLVAISEIPKEHHVMQEMDINPLILHNKAIVVDARIILE